MNLLELYLRVEILGAIFNFKKSKMLERKKKKKNVNLKRGNKVAILSFCYVFQQKMKAFPIVVRIYVPGNFLCNVI